MRSRGGSRSKNCNSAKGSWSRRSSGNGSMEGFSKFPSSCDPYGKETEGMEEPSRANHRTKAIGEAKESLR